MSGVPEPRAEVLSLAVGRNAGAAQVEADDRLGAALGDVRAPHVVLVAAVGGHDREVAVRAGRLVGAGRHRDRLALVADVALGPAVLVGPAVLGIARLREEDRLAPLVVGGDARDLQRRAVAGELRGERVRGERPPFWAAGTFQGLLGANARQAPAAPAGAALRIAASRTMNSVSAASMLRLWPVPTIGLPMDRRSLEGP